MEGNKSKLNKQRDIELIIFVVFFTYMALQMLGVIPSDRGVIVNHLLEFCGQILVVLPSFVAYLLQGKNIRELFRIEKGQLKLVFALVLFKLIVFAFMCFLGITKVHAAYINKLYVYIIDFAYTIFVVAGTEEFIYRIYIQGTLEELFGKFSFLAPAVSALIFGCSHLVNVNLFNAVFNVFMGLVWGYARYFNKKCTYTALVATHGLSNIVTEIPNIIYGIIK